MGRRATNSLLLRLVPALVASGLVGWIWPVPTIAASYPLHRALGAALLLVLIWKYPISRSSLARRLPRRAGSVVWGGRGAAALLGCLGLGLAWTLGLVSFAALGAYSPLNGHGFLEIRRPVPAALH